MACMKLGSKSEALRLDGQTWICSSGLASDVTIQVKEFSFQLHKFPLISRSGLLENRLGDFTSDGGSNCVVILDDLPGGPKAFELVVKYCYGIKFELTSSNVVYVRCAAEFLEMNEEFGEGNLIAQTEVFLSEVFNSWSESLKALIACEEVLSHAEEAQVVSRCINSLALKVSSDPSLFGWPISKQIGKTSKENEVWNGISTPQRLETASSDWWYEDISSLSLPLYKRLIKAIELRGIKLDRVCGSIMYYAKKNIPLMSNNLSSYDEKDSAIESHYQNPTEDDQRYLLEEIVNLLPIQKGVTHTKFLLRLLKTAMNLHSSLECIENLEKRVGAQLEEAALVDLLIPNTGIATDTLYDVDCIQRIVDHFMQLQQSISRTCSPIKIEDEEQLESGSQSIGAMAIVAELVDSYLAEIASDGNMKPPKFQCLAGAIPDYVRPRYDGFYHAVDIFLKAHPWLSEAEREQICKLMNCQKLSLEASTHAAQNERLPLRVVVQVLFFEQLRLRTQISGWFFVSDNLDNSQIRNTDGGGSENALVLVGDVRDRVSELEKECITMRQEMQRLTKTKKKRSIFSRMFVRPKSHPHTSKLIESKRDDELKELAKMHDVNNTKIVELDSLKKM